VLVVGPVQGGFLPPLPFVAAEIVDIKRSVGLSLVVKISLLVDQPLAASVDGEASEICHNPPATETFCCRARSAATAKKIGY
jgi:hypothetical protein